MHKPSEKHSAANRATRMAAKRKQASALPVEFVTLGHGAISEAFQSLTFALQMRHEEISLSPDWGNIPPSLFRKGSAEGTEEAGTGRLHTHQWPY